MNENRSVSPNRGRLFLLLIALAFVAPAIIAGILVWSGWQPGSKAEGEPILPQRNFVQEDVQVRLQDGQLWPWRDSSPRFTLIVLAGPDCATQCFDALTGIAKARVMLNRTQSRLRLLYLGTPPADAAKAQAMEDFWSLGTDVGHKLESFRPTAPDSVSAILVESNGTALALYPAGSDLTGLLRDMRKVIK